MKSSQISVQMMASQAFNPMMGLLNPASAASALPIINAPAPVIQSQPPVIDVVQTQPEETKQPEAVLPPAQRNWHDDFDDDDAEELEVGVQNYVNH